MSSIDENRVDVLRPLNDSIIHDITKKVYEAVMDYASQYPHSGTKLINDLGQNYIISSMSYESVTRMASISGCHDHNFTEVYNHFYGDETEERVNIGVNEATGRRRNRLWPDIFKDLCYMSASNKELRGVNKANFFLDNVLIAPAIEVFDNHE